MNDLESLITLECIKCRVCEGKGINKAGVKCVLECNAGDHNTNDVKANEVLEMRWAKSGLDVARNRKIISRTSLEEAQIKKELESSGEPILSDEVLSDILQKEYVRKARYLLKLKKTRLKIMRTKERATTIQCARQDTSKLGGAVKSGKKRAEFNPNLKEIKIEY